MAEQYNSRKEKWTFYNEMVYPDGSTTPPTLLRDEPKMNYLDPTIRNIGLLLMGIGLLLSSMSVVWVYWNRNHSVVVAAQPLFLYFLSFGAAMVVSVTWLTSFDESYGWSQEMLSKACVGGVWVDALGHMITFSALFTKVRIVVAVGMNRAMVTCWCSPVVGFR